MGFAPPEPAKDGSMPPHREPMAVANEPVKVYQANAVVRVEDGTTCERAACSIDRNGPTSLPLGLKTPMVPAITRNKKLLVQAKAGAGHKEGPENEHPPTPNTVRLGCENQGNDRVPQEYQGEKHSDPRFTESNAGQIEDENNGQRAVSK